MVRIVKKVILIKLLVLCVSMNSTAQGFLKASGTKIVDGNNQNFILRGIGTGNWVLMEGYMMKTTGELGTQHAFRAKLEEEIGVENTNAFFETWWANHMTRADVDSMKAWGFNSVRAAMHYKMFTPPIEDEPVQGEITWIEKGFVMIDTLLDWCADNEMYLILDMHGTPGGQGKNADISDYDHTKPSLWESEENKTKLTALWYELAKRYKEEPWIGGYDLINETNWDFENSGNENGVNCVHNIPLLEMHKRLIDTVRTIDNNHIVFVSGNSWGNNYNGMDALASHDDNLAYTFHKYWNTNNENDVEWITNMRDRLNVPLWMSESGENSNVWYTEAIKLFEENNIGWSWWPVKKEGINNVLKVEMPGSYDTLTRVWKNELSVNLTKEQVFKAVMDWAENHKIENCIIKYDVIDAMRRQPYTKETLPFKKHNIGEPIYFSDFDLGTNGYAYQDTYVANYGGEWTGWNNGWGLRNDGVDIEACLDETGVSNGYNVGWTDDGEWMQYTLNSETVAAYTLSVRSASGSDGSNFHLEVNGAKVTESLALPGTGGWQTWETTTFEDVIIPAGEIKIKFHIDKGGSNLSYFKLGNPKSIDAIDFVFMEAKTTSQGDSILLTLNKPITTIDTDLNPTDFEFKINGEIVELSDLSVHADNDFILVLTHQNDFYSDNNLTISYNGNSVKNNSQNLIAFTDEDVKNNLSIVYQVLPGKVQAEDFAELNGFSVGNCSDEGGGSHLGYTKAGYYTTYRVSVQSAGDYKINYRVATERAGSVVNFEIEENGAFKTLAETDISSTGAWTTWETQSSNIITLPAGYYNVRIFVKSGEFDLNWFEVVQTVSVGEISTENRNVKIYPNPTQDFINVSFSDDKQRVCEYVILNNLGQIVLSGKMRQENPINISNLKKGIYYFRIDDEMKKIIKY